MNRKSFLLLALLIVHEMAYGGTIAEILKNEIEFSRGKVSTETYLFRKSSVYSKLRAAVKDLDQKLLEYNTNEWHNVPIKDKVSPLFLQSFNCQEKFLLDGKVSFYQRARLLLIVGSCGMKRIASMTSHNVGIDVDCCHLLLRPMEWGETGVKIKLLCSKGNFDYLRKVLRLLCCERVLTFSEAVSMVVNEFGETKEQVSQIELACNPATGDVFWEISVEKDQELYSSSQTRYLVPAFGNNRIEKTNWVVKY